jgi:transcriptional regulator with XRE-family HTH domain
MTRTQFAALIRRTGERLGVPNACHADLVAAWETSPSTRIAARYWPSLEHATGMSRAELCTPPPGHFHAPDDTTVTLHIADMICELREARRGAGLTQRTLAQHMGLTVGRIGRLEKRRENPSPELFVTWCHHLARRVTLIGPDGRVLRPRLAAHPDERHAAYELRLITTALHAQRRTDRLARTQLAEALTITTAAVRSHETGRRTPHLPALIRWAAALGCTLTVTPAKAARPADRHAETPTETPRTGLVLDPGALRDARLRLNLPQHAFAEAVNLAVETATGYPSRCGTVLVTRWENGDITMPQPRYRAAIATVTQRPFETLCQQKPTPT